MMKLRNRNVKRENRVTAVLLNSPEVADLLNISEQHLFRLNAEKKIPAPIKLGKSVRWSRQELLDWIAAGAPSRTEWLRVKGDFK